MKRLDEMFDVSYGNKLDLNKMSLLPISSGGVHFVGRSSENHGVTATVAPLETVEPYEGGLITVALGGTKLLASFVQSTPFYTAQNVAILRPKKPMRFAEKLFMCLCIRHNRFRYSAFGREANRTLRELEVPELTEFPEWGHAAAVTIDGLASPMLGDSPTPKLDTTAWKYFEIQELFKLRKGKRLTKANMEHGTVPYIGAIDKNNGVSAFVAKAIHDGNTITVNYNGSVAEAFYQPEPFWCSDDVNVLYPKFVCTPSIGLFFTTIIRMEKFRYSYGRKWHLDRMRTALIRLPTTPSGVPDWNYMERYMMSLPFSSQIEGVQVAHSSLHWA
jgi:hypothetical protein